MSQIIFVKRLMKWHQVHNFRQMPWKEEKDPYKIWISEIILQQTRVEQGRKYYERFIATFPDIKTLATAEEDKIFKLWEGLGYYARCRNLIATAKTLHFDHNGDFPSDYHSIIGLKGIGSYTAAAIASFAFGLPYAVVDGNVRRVLARYFAIRQSVDTARGKKQIDDLAQALICKKNPAAYNQAIMDFGASVCRPGKPDCDVCPLRKTCASYRANIVSELPVKSKNARCISRFFNYFLIRTHSHIYVRKRTSKDIWQHLYELPNVETTSLVTSKKIQTLPDLAAHFRDGTLRLEKVSSPRRQRLTHQEINCQIIHIHCSRHIPDIMDSIPIKFPEIQKIAFPVILAGYLQEETFI